MRLSIIIPALNEANTIGRLIPHLKSSLVHMEKSEIIVADGGSVDGTKEIAANAGATVIECSRRGRAVQMNDGAALSRGDVFYFLHADSFPPPGFDRDISDALDRGADCGSFRLQFDDTHPVLNIYGWFTRFDVDLFRFGDQSLFIKRRVFLKTGGFAESLLLMEDHEIVKRIRRSDAEFVVLDRSVITSARKYRTNGPLRLQFFFTVILVFWYAGAGQDVLIHLYRSLVRTHRRPSRPG